MSFIEMDFASGGGGGGYTVTKVWENTAPTTAMNAANLTWDNDDDYDFYVVISRRTTSEVEKRLNIIKTNYDLASGFNNTVLSGANSRSVTNITKNGFSLSKPSSSGSYSIPLYIFKVKVDGLMSEFDEYIN